jgi:ABC-type transport system involved in multi-copper enzyme maturation permease subunit
MRYIFKRELLEQFQSFKFSAGLLLVLLLFGVNGAVFSLRYKNEVVAYRRVLERWERHLNERKKLDDLPQQDFEVMKVPLKTAFLAAGGQDRLPDTYRFTIRIWGSMPATLRAASENALIESFQALDWSFLAGTAFSLLALVFAYDSVSGEKERGTLKLLQTYRLSRNSILAGKLLANLAALFFMLLAGMLLSLFLLLLVGQIDLGAAEWARVALFLGLSGFYLTLFLSLGLFLSTLTHRPTTSMVLAIMVWVISVLVIPGVGTLIIQQVRKLPTQNEVSERSRKVWDVIEAEFKEHASDWRGRDGGKSDNYLVERVSIVAQNKRKHLQEEIWEDYLRQKFQQAEAVRRISALSPTALFGYGAESINGTGVLRDQLLVEEAHLYRNTVEEWLRERDSADPQSPHLCFQPGYLSLSALNSASVPRYLFREATVAEGLRDALWKVILLSAETLMMLFAAVWVFQRYDVR